VDGPFQHVTEVPVLDPADGRDKSNAGAYRRLRAGRIHR